MSVLQTLKQQNANVTKTIVNALHHFLKKNCLRWHNQSKIRLNIRACLNVQKKQRKNYSGKKKRHTIKSQLIADPKTRLVLSVDQAEGCVHDFRIYKDCTGAAVSPDIIAKTDSGYQGIAAWHANSEVPYKKSKNHPLTPEEKA